MGQATRKRRRIARQNRQQEILVNAFSDKIRQMRLLERASRDGHIEAAKLAKTLRDELVRDLGMNPDDVEIGDE